MNKEEFNWFWKDTPKEGVLNQFYYEHIQLREEIERINKAIEYINDNVAVYAFNNKELPHWEFNDDDMEKLLKILRGEENVKN